MPPCCAGSRRARGARVACSEADRQIFARGSESPCGWWGDGAKVGTPDPRLGEYRGPASAWRLDNSCGSQRARRFGAQARATRTGQKPVGLVQRDGPRSDVACAHEHAARVTVGDHRIVIDAIKAQFYSTVLRTVPAKSSRLARQTSERGPVLVVDREVRQVHVQVRVDPADRIDSPCELPREGPAAEPPVHRWVLKPSCHVGEQHLKPPAHPPQIERRPQGAGRSPRCLS